jgi:spore maturation protein SpmB
VILVAGMFHSQAKMGGVQSMTTLFTEALIPLLMAFFLLVGFIKRVPIYETLTAGASEGFKVAVKIIPFMVAIFAATAMFRASGALELLSSLLAPLTTLIGMPTEAISMALIRPLSGSGAFGIMSDLGNLWGLIDVRAKLERRFLGEQFTPAFFDALYDIHRYNLGLASIYNLYEQNPTVAPTELDAVTHKSQLLSFAPYNQETIGVYGELVGDILGVVKLVGAFQSLDEVKNSGVLHFSASAPDAIPMLAAHATYDKVAIETLDDVLTLDYRSVARVGLGYKIKPYLILFMDYIWNFVPDGHGGFKSQERVEPRLSFVYNFGI